MHWWDRLPALPPTLVDWAQVSGTALSLLALIAAASATISAKRDLVTERRRQHDLEILREIGSRVPSDPLSSATNAGLSGLDIVGISSLLLMLPRWPDFRFTRIALGTSNSRRDMLFFENQLDRHLTGVRKSLLRELLKDDSGRIYDQRVFDQEQRLRFVFAPNEDGESLFRSELNEAISRRMR